MLAAVERGTFRSSMQRRAAMRPVTDRAEVSIDFPEKAYIGSFGHAASFAATAAADGVELKLAHAGQAKRVVDVHLHWYLFTDVIDEIAASLEGRPGLVDEAHRAVLAEAIARLATAVAAAKPAAEENGTARHG
jgi:hypothetical protein